MASNKQHHKRLGQFFSTAICGNDILSSALYVSGITALFAGVYAPLILVLVACVLFFYKAVYTEVVESLPINGGAYNALLNATSKVIAAIAGVMTILSYVATAVISAKTAVEYLFKFFEVIFPDIHFGAILIPSIIVILFAFALLVISGVKDSAKVAAIIFTTHIITLTSFVLFGIYYIFIHSDRVLIMNAAETTGIITSNNGLLVSMFLAFSVSLLGVSGFESSANFVEEQEPGVFRKTLRNMLLGVIIFNPLICWVVLRIATIPDIVASKDYLLANVAQAMGGVPYLGIVAINAFLVLCGAVLTSYVGVTGLIKRMTLDECLPSFLLKETDKKTNPLIILGFFVLCTSILIVTKADLLSLAGVYTISFLGVMTMFAIGNLLLRKTRPDLKRPYRAAVGYVIIAAFATLAGVLGNLAINKDNGLYFLTYFIPTIGVVMLYIFRADVLRVVNPLFSFIPPLYNVLQNVYKHARNPRYYLFLHHTSRLYEALEYINKNESGHNVRVVHCYGNEEERENLKNVLPSLKKAGVFPFFKIDFDYMPEPFGPQAIDHYARKRRINKNRIFIGSIHGHHEFDYADLGGVRIISG